MDLLFRFPRNNEKREAWRQLLGLEHATDYMQICAAHFRPQDLKKCKGLHRLAQDAQPQPCGEGSASGIRGNATNRAGKPKCFVPGCRTFASDDTTLHRFPRLYERRQQWASLLQVQKVPSMSTVICSNHFLPSDFRISADGKKILAGTATPSLHLNVSLGANEPTNSQNNEGVADSIEVTAEGAAVGPACNTEEVCTEEVCTQPCSQEEGSDKNSTNALPLSHEDESVNDPSTSLHSHEHGLDSDSGQSLEEVLSAAGSDASEISSVFKKVSTQLKEDIANIRGSPSSSFQNENKESASHGKAEPSGTQTDTTAFNIFDLITDDTQMKAFTGVTFATFDCLLKLVLELYGEDDVLIPMKNRIFLTFCRLRLNLSYECLSAMVGIERRKYGSIFASTLHLLSVVLQHIVYWPSKEEVLLNMPKCFQKYTDTRVVLDCTEVPICSPDCLKCRIRLYSHYKGCQTVKILVGVSPSGLIVFVSKVYGGRASDKQIFLESDLITKNLLEPFVDAVMVDKGFRIDAVCNENHIKIHRPSFVVKKQPLSEDNARLNNEIAHARVHVERVIQRMKIFKILQSKISWAMVPYLDEIFVVIAGLVNLSAPILADDKFMSRKKP